MKWRVTGSVGVEMCCEMYLLVLVDLLLQILPVPPESREVEILSLLCEWVCMRSGLTWVRG